MLWIYQFIYPCRTFRWFLIKSIYKYTWCKHLFINIFLEIIFNPLGYMPKRQLLGCMESSFLHWKGTVELFSRTVVLYYFLNINVWEIQFLGVFSQAHNNNFYFILFYSDGYVISLSFLFISLIMMLNIFSFAFITLI